MARFLLLAQTINLDLQSLKFRPAVSSAANQTLAAVVLLVIVAVLAAVVVYAFRRRKRMMELALAREEARLRLMLTELNLGEEEQTLLTAIAGSGHPSDVLPLVETRAVFEETLLRFRDANPNAPELKRVSRLRQRLEYGFSNIRNPFVDTRMLAPGIRMRCRIRLPRRDVNFLTTVLGINENHFIIRPPSAKGKPVAFAGVDALQFRVSRENDAEYEFTSPIIAQQPDGMRAVLMGHTREISRMLFRHAERVDTELATQFYVIRQEYASERSTAHLKALDSQYVIDGVLQDLSIGGALVMANGRQDRLHDGDIIVFRLPGAQMKDDVVSQVVGILPRDDESTQIHLQFMGMKELNRLKLGKFLDALKQRPPPVMEGGQPSAPAAP